MLFLLSGASGSGKTTLGKAAEERLPRLAFHELTEIAERPWNRERDGPFKQWRCSLTEGWLKRAVQLDEAGHDLLLAEAVLGEVLAAPSAKLLSGIAACLVDCADEERMRRIRMRPEGARRDPEELWHLITWGVWLRFHAADPQFFVKSLADQGDPDWRWERWTRWRRGDPRWAIYTLDTTNQPTERSAQRLIAWIDEQRAAHQAGELPLSGCWWDS